MINKILIVVRSVHSLRDANGNTYHSAQFFRTDDGKSVSVAETGGDSNARWMAEELLKAFYPDTDNYYPAILEVNQWETRKNYNRITKEWGYKTIEQIIKEFKEG